MPRSRLWRSTCLQRPDGYAVGYRHDVSVGALLQQPSLREAMGISFWFWGMTGLPYIFDLSSWGSSWGFRLFTNSTDIQQPPICVLHYRRRATAENNKKESSGEIAGNNEKKVNDETVIRACVQGLKVRRQEQQVRQPTVCTETKNDSAAVLYYEKTCKRTPGRSRQRRNAMLKSMASTQKPGS